MDINMTRTPPHAHTQPTTLGDHTQIVLREVLAFYDARIAALRNQAVI